MSTLKKKIVFVAGIHGNEQVPVDALSRLGVPFIVGNPEALSKHVRYIDEDLNRVFGISGNTYERKRAEEILESIPIDANVVDFHTASAVSKPFAIITNSYMMTFASIIGIRNVILFTESSQFISNSLIHKRMGIVIECGCHTEKNGVSKVIQKVLRNCKMGKKHVIKVYEVVCKNTNQSVSEDFRKTNDGLYPILSGARNHTGGYLAR